ncbi:MAG TPA: DUF3868 domain-containing protein [Candidatus Butyricimonas faecavium]|nr:DUF3868 domain-containing protein [Candidatus Butyricimonas faecavium]
MRNILLCGFFFLFSFLALGQEDSTVVVNEAQLYRMGKQLVVSMQINISRELASNESLVLIPQLRDSLKNFMEFPRIYINGRRQHFVYLRNTKQFAHVDHLEVRREDDSVQTITYLRSVPFEEWMNHSVLSLEENSCHCGEPEDGFFQDVARLNTLSELHPQLAFITPQIEEVKNRDEKICAYLDFPLNKTDILEDFRNNAAELHKIKESIDVLKRDSFVMISGIHVHGFASPEGPYMNNKRLAEGRTSALKNYISDRYDFPDSVFTTNYTPEDWEGVRRLLCDSVFKNGNEWLRVIESDLAPDQKEQRLRRRYSRQFSIMVSKWFPALRRSECTIKYVVRPFTLEEARIVFHTQPKNLSIEEMFRIAQTLPEGSQQYMNVFKTAVLYHPENPVANLNAACIALMQGDVVSAEKYLLRAPDGKEKTLATGVMYMLKGLYGEAKSKFMEAETFGLPQASYNLKLLNTIY